MYKVARLIHEKHGSVIEITREDIGQYDTPFKAINQAISMRRLWLKEGEMKVRFLIDGQVMITKRIESWANEEYKSLPKCEECGKILSGDVYTHQLCDNYLFCTQSCADKNFSFQDEKMNDNDEEECDL